MHSILRLVTVLLLVLPACSERGADLIDKSPETPVSLPERVTNLTATAVSFGVELDWAELDDVEGYRVYRTMAGNPKIKLVADVRVGAHYRDSGVVPGNSYTYRVAGYVEAGEGPMSESASVEVVHPYESWAVAPYDPPAGAGYESQTPVPVWNGGDEGYAAWSTFPSNGVSDCSVSGYEVLAVRPGTTASVPVTGQTFSMTLAYKITSADTVAFRLVTVGGPYYYREIVDESVDVAPGCGKVTFTVTIDASVLLLSEEIYFYVRHDSMDMFSYRLEGAPRVSVASSVPADSAVLDGASPIQLTIDYEHLEAGNYIFSLGSYYSQRGVTEVSLAGTGSTTVELPYTLGCDAADIDVRLRAPEGNMTLLNSPAFAIDTNRAVHTRFSAEHYAKLSDINWFSGEIYLRACDWVENVTVSAAPGFLIERYNWNTGSHATGQSIAGTTDDYWQLQIDDTQSWSAQDYDSVLTVAGPDGTSELDFTLHVFSLSWVTLPPQNPVGGVEYPVALTGENLAANLSGAVEIWGENIDLFPLTWDGDSYDGAVSFPTCGDYSLSAEFDVAGSVYLYGDTYSVGSSIIERHTAYPSYISFSLYNGYGQRTISVGESCGGGAAWQIVSAPPWVRFEKLSGSAGEDVRVAFYSLEADSPWADAAIWIDSGLPDGPLRVFVSYQLD